MPARPFCYIDTVDSDKHYSVVGTPEEVAGMLSPQPRVTGPPPDLLGRFVKFTIADRDKRAVYIDPDKVIAVLEPVR